MTASTDLAPGFRMTEIGPLPEEWTVTPIGAPIAELLSGDWGDGSGGEGKAEVSVVRGTDFTRLAQGDLTHVPRRYIKLTSLKKRRLRADDLLLEISGGSAKQPTGRLVRVTAVTLRHSNLPVLCSNFVKLVRVDTSVVLPAFYELLWLHHYTLGRTRIHEKRTTGIHNFKHGDFLKSEVTAIPPLPEQRKIAAVLDTVRRAIEATDKVIAAAKELKRSLLQYLFTYGPVPHDRADQVPLKETEIGPMPEGWEVAQLGEYCGSPQYGFTATAQLEPVGPRFLRITDIQNGEVLWSAVPYCNCPPETKQRYTVQSGDILVARIGATTGKSYLIRGHPEAVFASYLMRLRAKEGLLPSYLWQYMSSAAYWRQIEASRGGKLKSGLSASELRRIELPVPSPEEQSLIGGELEALDSVVAVYRRRGDILTTLFTVALHRLMTGQVRVDELDLPAGVQL
jgi:type I restriction enzyme S subunit